MPCNKGAYRFWTSVIREYTDGEFTEYTKTIPHFNDSIKDIFRFNTIKD